MKRLKALLCLAIFCALMSCKSEFEKVLEDNEAAIEDHINRNGWDYEKTEAGVYYVVEQEGNGTHPTLSDIIDVQYTGYKLDGTIFDSSGQDTASFGFSRLIEGWRDGIPQFSEGGAGKLFIPAHMAYGENPPSNNNAIGFDIKLLKIK